ncbi:MAG: hypothetical protein WD904_09075 [Dehalococcoidia bacterium]
MSVRSYPLLGIIAVAVITGAIVVLRSGAHGSSSASAVAPAGWDSSDICNKYAVLSLTMTSGFANEEAISLPANVSAFIDCLIEGTSVQAAPGALIPVSIESPPPWVNVEGDFLFSSPGTLVAEGLGTVAGVANARVVLDVEIETEVPHEVTGTYTMGADGELPGGEPAVYEVNGHLADDVPTVTPTSEPTPTNSPTAPPGETVVWGNNNCSDGPPDPVDSLLALRFDAGLSTNTGDCPSMGVVVEVQNASPHPWGDIDCGGDVNPVDSLKLLRFDGGLSVAQEPGCPQLGSEVEVT